MKHPLLQTILSLAVALPFAGHAADAARQAEVTQRGGEVMPFSLAATIHVFTQTAHGGVQRVVAKDHGADAMAGHMHHPGMHSN